MSLPSDNDSTRFKAALEQILQVESGQLGEPVGIAEYEMRRIAAVALGRMKDANG